MMPATKIILLAGMLTFLSCLHTKAENERITQEEFECYLRVEPPSAPLKEKWENFMMLKLKAADARARGWDTLPSFIQLYKSLQGSVLKSLLLASEKSGQVPAAKGAEREPLTWVRLEQYAYPLAQHATRKEERMAVCYMDSVYGALQQQSAASFSRCRHTLTWYPEEILLQEFISQTTSTPANQYSKPFYSPLGLHIIRVIDRKVACDSPEEGNRSVKDAWKTHKELNADAYEKWKNSWTPSDNERIQARLKTVRDSLLAVCWDQYNLLSLPLQIPDDSLDSYFRQHQEEYRWELPHFKGAVIWCKNKKMASRIKRYLKKCDPSVWDKALSRLMKEDTGIQARMETGLYQIGKNPYVDRLAFKCGTYPEDAAYPYVFVMGKRLKKGPEAFSDVYEKVSRDYRRWLQLQQIALLKERFPLDFDSEVLKTVNCSGNN